MEELKSDQDSAVASYRGNSEEGWLCQDVDGV